MKVTKKIFGKNYQFTASNKWSSYLEEAIYLYPDSEEPNGLDVIIHLDSVLNNEKIIARNPSTFAKFDSGITTDFGSCKISWNKKNNSPLEINVALPLSPDSFRNNLWKFRTMEYSTETERLVQILHELVLVPSVYFFNDLSIVHAAVIAKEGGATLLAGTGGTGKTSALLALRKSDKHSFVSDDIAIVSKDGYVFPNLAWPKVYGYNLSSYITKDELLKGRSKIDRIQFDYRLKRNPKTVRRKLRPDILYKNCEINPIPIKEVIYLFRDDSSQMNLQPLDTIKAIDMGVCVMKTEYGVFHNFIEWDNYNSLGKGLDPIIDLGVVFETWKENLTSSFENVDIKMLSIPYDVPHEEYLDFMNKLL